MEKTKEKMKEKITGKIIVKENIPYLILSLLLVFVIIVALNQQMGKNRYMNSLHNTYRVSLSNAAVYADGMDSIHSILPLAYTPENTAPLLAELWRQAEAAHESLTALPYHDEMIGEALGYFAKTSELAYGLMVKTTKGIPLTQADWAEIDKLKTYSNLLSTELNMLLSQINLGEDTVYWDQLQKETPYATDFEGQGQRNIQAKALLGSMANVNKGLQGYHEEAEFYNSLGGPGASTGTNALAGSRLLSAAREITSGEGGEIVKDFLKGFDIDKVVYTGATDVTAEQATPLYSYDVVLAGSVNPVIAIDITQEGGYPLWMLNYSRIEPGNNYISMDKAVKMGDKFLMDAGYSNMQCIYQETIDGVSLLYYVPVIEDTTIYADMIKLKVGMTDGSILGFEASGYLRMHHDRGELTPRISQEDAADMVSDRMLIKSVAMAIIPVDGQAEAYCYEFKGDYEGNSYAIFIHGDTGDQVRIVKNKD